MLSDVSIMGVVADVPPYPQPGVMERFRRALANSRALNADHPFVSFAGVQHRTYRVRVLSLQAVLPDYAIAGVCIRELDSPVKRQKENDFVFILRPPLGVLEGELLACDAKYFARVEGIIAGCACRAQPGTRLDRLVLSIAPPTLEALFTDTPIPDVMFMRMFHECIDIPVIEGAEYAPVLQTDPGWIERPPADDTTRSRGVLYVGNIQGWCLDAGLVSAEVYDTAPEEVPDDEDETAVEALMVPPVVSGLCGPWVRMDTFKGVASRTLAAAARGRRGQTRRPPKHVPIFALDLRSNYNPDA
jgi:hypothetical protein